MACLNCGASLHGPFCAECGQRAVPAYPTLREYAGDAWEEISGLDGRFARTLRTLMTRPGRVTVETLEGRRAHYIKPLRLYLSVSVLYFVIAAAAPNDTRRDVILPGEGKVKIDVMAEGQSMTPEERAAALEELEDAPAMLRPLFITMIEDPAGFRSRVIASFPRMMFALVPVFAGILALFYRRRRYLQHLIFALHTNAGLFLALIPAQLIKVARSDVASAIAGVLAVIFIAWYVIRAQRVVYGDGLLLTMAKSAGFLALYAIVAIPALFALIAWAAYFR